MNSKSERIIYEMNVFGNGITAVYTMYSQGSQISATGTSLKTSLFENDVPLTGLVSAESGKKNDKMRDALVNELSGRLAVSVYQVINGESLANEPIGEFLRHIRNGIAHDNRFLVDEIKRPAEWRGHSITKDMDGERVLSTVESPNLFMSEGEWKNGYVEAGDIKELTIDILEVIQD